MKRYLFLAHRWLGIALCLFMAMWFLSGVVMMYVGYPRLTQTERLSALPELDAARCCADLATAIAVAGERHAPQTIRLAMVAHTPRFILGFDKDRFVAVDARSGARSSAVTPEGAVASARAFMSGADGTYEGAIDEDAWTHSKALEGHRPLHRVQMADPGGTLLYVSGTTGEVVRDASRTERIWNWAGAWIHYLYLFRGGIFDAYWKDIIVYTSLTATILAAIGLTVGLLRWRFRGHYTSGSKSPYRGGHMRWHHLSGLAFGLFALTWIFSGMMSMNPWKIFDSPTRLDLRAYAGGELDAERFPLGVAQALTIFAGNHFHPREIEWRLLDGKGYYIGHNDAGQTLILPSQAGAVPLAMFPIEQLEHAGARLVEQAKVKAKTVLTAYDFYYYGRAPHTMAGTTEKRLPVLRLEFNDPLATWAHIDPYTGAVLRKLDLGQRWHRWLFAFPHSWDWRPLIEARPLWDVLLIVLSIGGFLVSCTGIVIGWHRLKRKQGKSGRKNPPVSDVSNAQAVSP
ncbi:MAG: PepSY domain-containing protein [Sulfurimicrobium sp.]|nr:PepSY domain-containing protein [Sulfurimicrobium sp.]MDP1704229.1 PepSY domain-containing protein [Sulfurimicrobium sp.]MDP2197823.1 PepSY domain-containing protein [Sulfurimicrobium sp.]